MKSLTINLDMLNLLNITPSCFVILRILINKESLDTIPHTLEDIKLLIERGFIDSKYNITEEGKKLFGTNKDYEAMWNQFIKLYPNKIGNRRLHTHKDKNKTKFIGYLKEGENFLSIIQGLTNEIDARNLAMYTGEFIPAWKNLTTYINNKSWEEYLDNEEINIENNTNII